LVLPFEISGSVSLLTAFAMGMTIDMFSYSHGVHTISLLLLAFVRPFLIRLMIRREEFGSKASPSIEQMGFRNFYVYMLILVLIHHTCLYLVDFFSLSQPLHMIRSILLSTLFTTILIIISQALFPDKQK
jgi:rod shape-determining protein MreD